MGRLIDRDKLLRSVKLPYIKKIVSEQKTVDAIPVDWIINFKNSTKAGALMEPREVIKFMLEAWKEEQKGN